MSRKNSSDGRCAIQGSMADKNGAGAFQTFQKLDHDGRLNLRCWTALPGQDLDNIIDLGLRTGFGNDRLIVGHVNFFSDEGSAIQHGPCNNRIYNFLPKFPETAGIR